MIDLRPEEQTGPDPQAQARLVLTGTAEVIPAGATDDSEGEQ